MTADEISDETRMIAEQVRARAAAMPGPDGIAGLAVDVLTADRGDMTPDQIRRLAVEAISQAQRVSYLLGRLAGLMEQPSPGGAG